MSYNGNGRLLTMLLAVEGGLTLQVGSGYAPCSGQSSDERQAFYDDVYTQTGCGDARDILALFIDANASPGVGVHACVFGGQEMTYGRSLERHLQQFDLPTKFTEWATLAQDRGAWHKLVTKPPFAIGKPFVRRPRGDTRVTPEDTRRIMAQRAAEIAERRAAFHSSNDQQQPRTSGALHFTPAGGHHKTKADRTFPALTETHAYTQAHCTSRACPIIHPRFDFTRATLAHPLHPAALAFVSYGIVLVQVQVHLDGQHHPVRLRVPCAPPGRSARARRRCPQSLLPS